MSETCRELYAFPAAIRLEAGSQSDNVYLCGIPWFSIVVIGKDQEFPRALGIHSIIPSVGSRMLAAANSAGSVGSIPTQRSGFSRAAIRIWNDYPQEIRSRRNDYPSMSEIRLQVKIQARLLSD